MADESPAGPDPAAQANPKSGPVEVPPLADPPHNKANNGGSNAPAWLMLLIYGGAAALYAAWTLPATRQIVDHYWQYMVIVLVVVIAILLMLRPAMSTGQKRMTFVVFIVVPLVVGLLGAVPLLDPRYQVSVLRVVFIAVVTLLPATMYFLFISTRKYSLLNEFICNLHRLGLLDERADRVGLDTGPPSESVQRVRLVAYVQKFEAAYGTLPVSLMDAIRSTPDITRLLLQPGQARLASSGVADVFTPETTPPLVISTVLMGLGWVTMLPPWQGGIMNWRDAFVIQDTLPHYYAFLGAYFFSIQMLFRRYVLRDLRASAYVAVSLRIVLATIATWVLVQISRVSGILIAPVQQSTPVEPVLVVTGFVVGVFPEVAWQYVQALLKRVTNAAVVVPSLATQLPISDLDGLTVWHQTRLEEEDIENIPNMATASIVELMLTTRVPPDRIIDWIDQAILYTMIGGEAEDLPRRGKLRECGFRTASSLVDAYWNHSNPKEIQAATGEKAPIELTVAALLTNPSLRLIQRWRRLPEEPLLRVPPLGQAARTA
jgi:hypothetical protein